MKLTAIIVGLLMAAGTVAYAQHEHDHGAADANKDHKAAAGAHGSEITVKGEVIDLTCYVDHEGKGDKHASCANNCIEMGLPVGILTEDGKLYLLVGEHKPINKALAPFAAKTVTIKGKFVTRNGMNMISNAELVK